MRPKKLNIDEAYQLYKLMGDSLKTSPDDVVMDVVMQIAKNVSEDNIFRAMDIMYGEDIRISRTGSLMKLLMNGLKENRMTSFYSLMSGISKHGPVS